MNRKNGVVKRTKIRKNRMKGASPATLKASRMVLSLKDALRVAGEASTVNIYSIS